MKINGNKLADALARGEGKKKAVLNAAQARETLKILRALLREHSIVEVVAWVWPGRL